MILFKNVSLLIDDHVESGYDLLVDGDEVKDIGTINGSSEYKVLDAKGVLVTPSFIDSHVHLREPGQEYKEDFITGSKAAAIGGFSKVCCMPNTNPRPDNPTDLKKIMSLAKDRSLVTCYFFSSITKGSLGKEVVDIPRMIEQGAIGFSDDGVGVQDAGIMKKAMLEAAKYNSIISAHCEENSLLNGGYIHDGVYAQTRGHKGISSSSESVQVARDVLLSGETNCQYHVNHISTRESVDMIRYGKARGFPVTCEVTPHHLLLSDEDLKEDGNYKMNPPLRSKLDKEALVNAFRDGIIDCIATDHAPHAKAEKELGLEKSAFGIIGLETCFSLLYSEFVLKKVFSLRRLIDGLTVNPAKIFKLPVGELKKGGKASFTFIDLEKEWLIGHDFYSKSSNSPFIGKKVKSKVTGLYDNGRLLMWEGKLSEKI